MQIYYSKIEKLIIELCPSGVESFALAELCDPLKKGTLKTGELSVDGNYPVINSGRSWYGRYDEYNNGGNAIAIAARGEYAGFINYIDEEFWAGGLCYPYRSKDENKAKTKFIFYYLKDRQEHIRETLVAHGSIPAINKSDIDKFKIPVPPLQVQEEIVKILDNFTELESELESELEAELEARKKQYDHYKKNLLTFDSSVQWFSLNNVCLKISAGGDLPDKLLKGQKFPTKEFPYPIYSNGSEEKALYGFTDVYRIDNEAVTISARGTIGYHTVREEKFTPIVRLLVLIPDNKIITAKFLNYILDITKIGHSGGSIPQLTVPNVKKIKIPVPPIKEQEQIVSILDKFDALVNDISIGLPAELKARRQQYEYYRGKLLTFKELGK